VAISNKERTKFDEAFGMKASFQSEFAWRVAIQNIQHLFWIDVSEIRSKSM